MPSLIAPSFSGALHDGLEEAAMQCDVANSNEERFLSVHETFDFVSYIDIGLVLAVGNGGSQAYVEASLKHYVGIRKGKKDTYS